MTDFEQTQSHFTENDLDNNICSLQEVNGFILNFHYGYSEVKNKLVCISAEDLQASSNNLGQSAAQIGQLSRLFAFFREQYSDNCPDVWRVAYENLRNYCNPFK